MEETVIKCEQVKEWNGKPIYGIHLSDGRGGESFQNIPVGTPMKELNIEQSNYGLKIKHNKPSQGGGFGGGRPKSGNESFALAYAKDLAVAYVAAGKTVEPQKAVEWAEVFYNWMESKKAK